MRVTLYTLPASVCHKCRLTKIAFDNEGIEYDTVRIDQDPTTLEYAKSLLDDPNGPVTAPIVHVDYGGGASLTWTDFRPDRIKRLSEVLTAA